MPLTVHPAPAERLSSELVAAFREIPPSIIGDELNRMGVLPAAIKPVAPGMTFAGEALTVQCMVGDNSAAHYAIAHAFAGSVLMIDGRGHEETALWGGIMTHAAAARGVEAVVINGAVRDLAELRKRGFPVFARNGTPAGPHKGWGGAVNVPIGCGSATIHPGDLLVGDDDGVIVVARAQLSGLIERCRTRLQREQNTIAGLDAGKLTIELSGLPPIDKVGR
jgi:4-hydroxy-4-methyl-2-oxoglutarate aldolase